MRKNMMALMLLLPILFVLIVYGAVNVSSLNVNISVNGIEIMERYPNDTISIDLASYDDSYEITPIVTPNNATNTAFEYRYELISGAISAEEAAAGGVVEVVKSSANERSDHIVANGVGTVRVVAVSKDGAYEDSITVIVGSSKPYAMDFSMYNDAVTRDNLLTSSDDDSYTADIQTGSYGFDVKLKPNTHISPTFNVTKGFAIADPARGSILLPFAGEVGFDVVIPGGVNGELKKHVRLDVAGAQATAGAILINGSADNNTAVRFDTLSGAAEFYVEAPEQPTVQCADLSDEDITVEKVAGVEHGYKVSAKILDAEEGDSYRFTVSAGNVRKIVNVNAVEFDFTIRSDIPNFDTLNGTNILMGTEISFYAVPVEVSSGVEYRWDFINLDDENSLVRSYNEDGSVCTMTARERDKFIIIVEAYRDDQPIPNIDAKEVEVEVINNVIGATSVDTNVGLAKSLAVPGHRYNADKVKMDNLYPVPINAHSPAGALTDGVNDFDYSINDNSIARIATDEAGNILVDQTSNSIYLEILGKGLITLTASWKGNADWRDDDPYELSISLTVDNDAVEVFTSQQLFAETDDGNPIVLGADILLGTDDNGSPLPLETRRSMLKQMKSTYNIEFYKALGVESYACVNYVVEFKNDVYGNGHSVSGEYFAHAVDSTDTPTLFLGPLYLVSFGGLASVSAQDNIMFLCRTDGVTIHNATLLGCNDSSRTNPETGMDDLARLEYVGTVVEINADVNLINCRIRNGRNVVRVYGGNRDGERYFVEALSQSSVTSQDRAVAHIEGCILSHSREFVLKIGTNRALRSGAAPNREPMFTDRNAGYYDKLGNVYLNDDYFYNSYVMTDVTLEDSVLEKSGLFCVGLETNFAGEMLCPDSRFVGSEYGEFLQGWDKVGGTSFPAILRLKGDVRMYDWKDLDNVNSDTLIKSDVGNSGGFELKLDLGVMIDYMSATRPEQVGSIVESEGGKKYVHGGIAVYGGGRNYSQVDISDLSDDRKNGLKDFAINISDLQGADGDAGVVAQYLPLAAGNQDFRFMMYESTSANNRTWQDSANYDVKPAPFR